MNENLVSQVKELYSNKADEDSILRFVANEKKLTLTQAVRELVSIKRQLGLIKPNAEKMEIARNICAKNRADIADPSDAIRMSIKDIVERLDIGSAAARASIKRVYKSEGWEYPKRLTNKVIDVTPYESMVVEYCQNRKSKKETLADLMGAYDLNELTAKKVYALVTVKHDINITRIRHDLPAVIRYMLDHSFDNKSSAEFVDSLVSVFGMPKSSARRFLYCYEFSCLMAEMRDSSVQQAG